MFALWLESGSTGVQIAQSQVADGSVSDVLLYLVFQDVEGSLAVITAALAAGGVNIKRVAAFTTSNGPAVIDTFQLDCFPHEAESRLLQDLQAHLA